jgi:competence protein ComEC
MPNMFFREAPFLRLVFPFLIGIVLYKWHPFWWTGLWFVILGQITVLYFLIYRVPTVWKYKIRFVSHAFIYSIFIVFGFANTHLQCDYNRPNFYDAEATETLIVVLNDEPILKGKYYKTKATIQAQGKSKKLGSILLYLEISAHTPHYGDLIALNSKLLNIEPPKNPHEFNYKKYLANQGIHHQCFTDFDSWQWVDRNKGNPIVSLGHDVKRSATSRISNHFKNDDHIGVLNALLLGDKSNLDGALKKTFSETGTMHVLAVSGLHVGIMFLLTKSLLLLFFRGRSKTIGVVLSIGVLWFFALITGFSPSVSRACFMFSLVEVGSLFKRNVSVYNSLACAAFFLLMHNPLNLFNLGFQFSFLAVVGIVTLQKPLRLLVNTKSWLLSKLIDLTAVSVAAQIATLPLILFYFGQFPLLFFVSNLLVIPVITVILYLGITVLVFYNIAVIASILSWCTSAYLWFLLESVRWIQSIPGAFIDHLFFSKIELVFLCLLTLAISGIILEYRLRLVRSTALICAIFLTSVSSLRKYQNHRSSEIIRFDLGKETCLILRNGNKIERLSNEDISDKDWAFHCVPYLESKNINKLDKAVVASSRMDSCLLSVVTPNKTFNVKDVSDFIPSSQKDVVSNTKFISVKTNL